MYYDTYSRGSKAYMALAGEIVRREEKLAQRGTAAVTRNERRAGMSVKKRGLGRGLDALLGAAASPTRRRGQPRERGTEELRSLCRWT